MNKRSILIIGLIITACICTCIFLIINNSNKKILNNNDEENSNMMDSNSVVIYFSATGNTKKVAEYIKEASGSDIIEIIPEEKYTNEDLSYSNDDCRANKEQNDVNARPQISNKINIEEYDVIYLGYPIWWGDVPKIILTLFDTHDFSGKTIIPFCTSGGSGISQSVNTLKTFNYNVKDGKRFNSSVTMNEVETWINEIK